MGSICYGGTITAKLEKPESQYGDMDVYPFEMPELSIDGYIDEDFRRQFYSTTSEIVELKRKDKIIKYKDYGFFKVYVNDKDGERLCEFHEIPSDYTWDSRTDTVWCHGYSVMEYDLENLKIKRYKMVLEKEENMSQYDLEEYGVVEKPTDDPNHWPSWNPLSDEEIQEIIKNKENK